MALYTTLLDKTIGAFDRLGSQASYYWNHSNALKARAMATRMVSSAGGARTLGRYAVAGGGVGAVAGGAYGYNQEGTRGIASGAIRGAAVGALALPGYRIGRAGYGMAREGMAGMRKSLAADVARSRYRNDFIRPMAGSAFMA
jgi:hypothetical protein